MAEKVNNGRTVLLVDDEESVLQVGRIMLEMEGYKVMVAEQGGEALDLFKRHKDEIDCVILDANLPDLAGDQAYRRILAEKSGVCVVLSSGYEVEDISNDFEGIDRDHFIQKPYMAGDLISKLEKVMKT